MKKMHYKDIYKKVFISRKEIKEVMDTKNEKRISQIMEICRAKAMDNNRIEPKRGFVYRDYFDELIGVEV